MKKLKKIIEISDSKKIKRQKKIRITDDCIEYMKKRGWNPMVAGVAAKSHLSENGKYIFEIKNNLDYAGKMILTIYKF